MTAVERIRELNKKISEIEELNKTEPQPVRAFTDLSVSFLLKAFRVMREIAIPCNDCEGRIDKEFEEKMKE